jgi:hypothetical protein
MKKIFSSKNAPLFLCGTLFFILFFGPILNKGEVILIFLLGLSIKIIAHRKIKRYFLIFSTCLLIPLLLIVLSCFLGFLTARDEKMLTAIALHVGIVAFLALYAMESLKEMMSCCQASIVEVISALNTYIIFGLIYGEIYAMVAYFQKGAFSITEKIYFAALHHSPIEDSWPYVYFSFITQTTLGFGDITPVSHLAQVIVISQGIFGQFYIAIVLAYLLHSYIIDHQAEKR